ncbi:MAG: corrinoid protein [Chitinophagaceae bacterium]
MENILEKIAHCIEFGKINEASPYPPELKGQPGADELTKQALQQGFSPDEILQKGFIEGMDRVGKKFSEHKIFVPQMLMSAKSMNTAMENLKPFFQSGEAKRKGIFVIGTVAGDFHEIGKNLAAMMIAGNGWEVIDLGKDVNTEKFIGAIHKNPGCVVGLSALLTTTMANMEETVKSLRKEFADLKILVGGAPINKDFSEKIGADFYAPDPQKAVQYLKEISG